MRAVPSAATVKFGRSPACGPSGLLRPCFFLNGLKCGPADSNGFSPFGWHDPTLWMCIACSPGGRFLKSTTIRTPDASSLRRAEPTLRPCSSSRSATAVEAAGPALDSFFEEEFGLEQPAAPIAHKTRRVRIMDHLGSREKPRRETIYDPASCTVSRDLSEEGLERRLDLGA